MIDYQQELNPSQCDAVLYTDGNCMVIAGAGSGKTRVLTYRIAHLLEEGVEPWSILALTFTNKAAGEMKQRIAARVGENRARYLWMGTFHSIFSRILRSEAAYIGYTSSPLGKIGQPVTAGISYTRRIKRPNYWMLNPFRQIGRAHV